MERRGIGNDVGRRCSGDALRECDHLGGEDGEVAGDDGGGDEGGYVPDAAVEAEGGG